MDNPAWMSAMGDADQAAEDHLVSTKPRTRDLSIGNACKLKWEAGRLVYGSVFVGNPLEQLDEELVDALNYIDEAVRWGYLVHPLRQAISEIREAARAINLSSGTRPIPTPK